MTSCIYTEIGEFLNSDTTYRGKPFFQKNINPLDTTHQVELQIAQKQLLHPQSNLVTVYEISYEPSLHIKYELLDVERELPLWSELEPQIITALKGLHRIRCIYIDMKDDNMGYSNTDNCWKLFDFDSSGICTTDLQKWIVKPPMYFQMRDITSLQENPSAFLDRVKYSNKDSVLSDLEKIKNKKELTRYDIISVFLCFGKIISLD